MTATFTYNQIVRVEKSHCYSYVTEFDKSFLCKIFRINQEGFLDYCRLIIHDA